MKTAFITATILSDITGLFCILRWSDNTNARLLQNQKDATWNGPCADTSTLLATTTGSPSMAVFTNKKQKMRVQIANVASPEEAAAVVFCECQK